MGDFLLDATTRHQIYLQRLAQYNANQFDPVLKRVDRIIREELSKSEQIRSMKQLNAIIKRIRREVGAQYSEWADSLIGELEKLVDQEADFTVKTLQQAVKSTANVQTPPLTSLLHYARVRPLQTSESGESTQLGPFVKSMTPRETGRVLGVIRNGYYQGETNSQIIRRIRGTREKRFTDGILNVTRRHAEAIAITGTNHAANSAKSGVFAKNKDILSGWMFASVLDSRTTNICRFHDGEVYPIGTGPVPPLHVRCRSAQVPEVKASLSVLGKNARRNRASKGASGGAQTRQSPYYEWLATQPKGFQKEVLGAQKTELFRKGKLSAEQFRKLTSNSFGEPLTLAQVQSRNPNAWRDAGLDT